MSCSLLTFCLYSLSYLFCGDVICGTFAICLTTCTTIGITYINVGIANGATLPVIIFCALAFVLLCSLLIPKLKALASSTLVVLLRTFLGDSIVAFFLLSNVVYISSLVFFTLASGFGGLSFW